MNCNNKAHRFLASYDFYKDGYAEIFENPLSRTDMVNNLLAVFTEVRAECEGFTYEKELAFKTAEKLEGALATIDMLEGELEVSSDCIAMLEEELKGYRDNT
tara:strand:+ start:256 stop:561 length:306 start_codon:yes stop_codon:yes gene_type:complete